MNTENGKKTLCIEKKLCGTQKRKQNKPQRITNQTKQTHINKLSSSNAVTHSNINDINSCDASTDSWSQQTNIGHVANTTAERVVIELSSILTQRIMLEGTRCRVSKSTSRELIPCGRCEDHFFNFSRLNSHLKSRHKARPFTCTKCKKGFMSKTHLQHHERAVHLREHPYQCEKCGQTFGWNSNATRHRKVCGITKQ